MTRPATSLVNAITRRLIALSMGNPHALRVSKRSMQQWLAWAKSIDARTRLDGSRKNKQRRVKR